MNIKTILAVLAGLVLAACAEDVIENNIVMKTRHSLTVEVMDEFAATTRADYSGFPSTSFETGDAIGIYAFDGSSYVASNIRFVRQSDGSWLPDEEVSYVDGYTYYAYFPYRATIYTPSTSGTVDAVDTKFNNFISDASNYFWQGNQSTKAGFTYSNLMIAMGTVTDVDSDAATVKFTMKHKRGLALIDGIANRWYYTDDAGTKYSPTVSFSGSSNSPYPMDGSYYFLTKPNVATSVAGNSVNISAGKYHNIDVTMTGTPEYTYSTNGGSSYSATRPSWLPEPIIVDGNISVSPDHSKTTNTVISSESIPASEALSGKPTLSNVDLSMVDNAGNTRASRTTANCYLVHNPGTYKIPLVYGNAIKDGATNTLAYHATESGENIKTDLVNHTDAAITDPWLKNNGAMPNNAELLWQDTNGMVTAVDIDGDFLTFTVAGTAAGNAVIAAKKDEVIVWSWHVWVTDETLSSVTSINADTHTYGVAPVNVGWISDKTETVYQGSTCIVRVMCSDVTFEFTIEQPNYVELTYPNGRNPYYQWGRKDPEIPYNCNTYDIAGNVVATSPVNTITTVSGAYSIGATIQNPDKHYNNDNNPYNEYKYNYWDINQNGTNIITTATVKTVYDPCPPCFCVPTSNLFYFMGDGSKRSHWDNMLNGKTWTMDDVYIYYPQTGYRKCDNSLVDDKLTGYCWSATTFNETYGYNRSRVLKLDNQYWYYWGTFRATGCAIRPVVEE